MSEEAEPTEADFWAAIAADPDDDTGKRWDFADWLNERDDPRHILVRDEYLFRLLKPGDTDPLPILLAALTSDDPDTAEAACKNFDGLRERGVAALLELFRTSPNPEHRTRALEALSEFDAEFIRPWIGELFPAAVAAERTGGFRPFALQRLAQVFGPDALPPLVDLFRIATDDAVKQQVLNAIVVFDADPLQPHLDDLLPAAVTAEREKRVKSDTFVALVHKFKAAATPAAPRLLELITEIHPQEVIDHIGPTLAAIGLHTLPAVLERINAVQEYFTTYSRLLDPNGDAVIPHLIEAAKGPPSQARTCAVLALTRLAPTAAVPYLREELRTATLPGLRNDLIRNIREIRRDGNWEHYVPPTGAIRAAVEEWLADPLFDFEEQYNLADVLLSLDSEVGVVALITHLDKPYPTPRMGVFHKLNDWSSKNPVIRAAVERLSRDPDEELRSAALKKLQDYAERDANRSPLEKLVEAWSTPDVEGKSVEELAEQLWDDDAFARKEAAEALGELGDEAQPALPELLRALADPAWGDAGEETHARLDSLSSSPDEVDGVAAIDWRVNLPPILAAIGPADEVIPGLAAAVTDDVLPVAYAAAEALKTLRPDADAAIAELVNSPDEDTRERADLLFNPAHDSE